MPRVTVRHSRMLLAIESTCDETAVAVIDDELRVLADVVASQNQWHGPFAGVVPEIAARAHLEAILPVLGEALDRAGISLERMDAIAVANTPGLAGSLLVGVVAAKTLAWVLGKPLIGVNHLHGHIYACQVATGKEIFPCVGFVVSGGHTNLFACDSPLRIRGIGSTIDDAAGEAFDKVGSLLGLPFPGGPAVAKLAEQGNERAYAFPRSFLHEPDRLQFSFSGLKTAVRYAIAGHGQEPLPPDQIPADVKADLAASFQAAVVEVLVDKAMRAIRQTGLPRLCVGGGVAANERFRRDLQQASDDSGVELLMAPRRLCSDNAVLGAIAMERLRIGSYDDLALPIRPGLERVR